MRTSVTIPDGLIDDLMRFSEARTRTEAVNRAVCDWVRRRKVEELRALRGTVEFDRGIEDVRREDMDEIEAHGSR